MADLTSFANKLDSKQLHCRAIIEPPKGRETNLTMTPNRTCSDQAACFPKV